ncbi:hypothetical protein ASD19_09740 [Microbacterium sp. Root53]|uniref:hypothetical protein n=1 Tax=Microbacterium sp. Root53 TaxID=1736553 RepID=UPI0006FDDFFA|nr:hypothetical protein [Microbacterium sp. Root53]KQY96822.1 hypothetical protein ASD19_09740 [Microbacterium sp. Root53]
MNWLTMWFEVERWEGTAGLLAGMVAASLVLSGFAVDRRVRRRARRAEAYAGALQAVHDYLEAPYRIRRGSGSASDRYALVALVSDIQSRIAYHEALLALVGPETVCAGYSTLVEEARKEAGRAMTAAWEARPTRRDAQVPLGGPLYTHPRSDRACEALLKAMKRSSR